MVIRGYKTQLLISLWKPHKSVSLDTVSRWMKPVMTAAGVDTMSVTGLHINI